MPLARYRVLKVLPVAVILPAALWCFAAISCSEQLGELAMPLAAAALAAFLLIFAAVRGFWRKCLFSLLLFGGILTWFFTQQPVMHADWQRDVERLPEVKKQGDLLFFRNIRNFNYRSETDFDVGYYDAVYDLRKLKSVDLLLVYWGSPHIAHVMMSFGFESGKQLAISVETRKKRGQKYSAVRGFFRAYELIYVVADERDLIRLRTNFRGEDVYLYRLQIPPERMRHMLLSYCKTVKELNKAPQFYNALIDNCATNALIHTKAYEVGTLPYSWKLLASGHLDEFAYQLGALNSSLPFTELKRQSRVNSAAKAADQAADFSAQIRAHLPLEP